MAPGAPLSFSSSGPVPPPQSPRRSAGSARHSGSPPRSGLAPACGAVATKICWVGSPKWLSALIGLALGWVAVAALPQLAHNEGLAPLFLLAAGGVAYTLGAVVYAL